MNAAVITTSSFLRNYEDSISRRETQVLRLIADEYTTKEIAQELFVSAHTIDSHRKKLMEKWHVRNTAGLIRVGFECGVLKMKTQLAI